MSGIIKFEFEGHSVRLANPDPEAPEWIAKDVCEALEIERTDSALRSLDADEKGTHTVSTPGGPQEMATVTEAGLYALIGRSRKPAAKRFRRWLNHEVLPSIRRTGGYVEPGREAEFLAVLQEQGRLILALTAEVKALREWKDSREQEHPYGLVGKRDAKALRGMFIAIRDMRIRLGDKRLQITVYRSVDDEIRRVVGYPNEKGASWANATVEQGRRAFSAASRMAEALRRDLDKINTGPVRDARQGKLFGGN